MDWAYLICWYSTGRNVDEKHNVCLNSHYGYRAVVAALAPWFRFAQVCVCVCVCVCVRWVGGWVCKYAGAYGESLVGLRSIPFLPLSLSRSCLYVYVGARACVCVYGMCVFVRVCQPQKCRISRNETYIRAQVHTHSTLRYTILHTVLAALPGHTRGHARPRERGQVLLLLPCDRLFPCTHQQHTHAQTALFTHTRALSLSWSS